MRCKLAWLKNKKVMVLPCVPFGVNTGQLDIPFVINMNPSTQLILLQDILFSLSKQNIRKLLIINGHGGNDFRQMIRECSIKIPSVFVCTIDWYKSELNRKHFHDPGDHAGEMETSMMMDIRPDLVLPLELAGNGEANPFSIKALNERFAWAPREWTKITKDTGVGNPEKANAENGKAFLNEICEKIADFLVDLCDADINNLYVK